MTASGLQRYPQLALDMQRRFHTLPVAQNVQCMFTCAVRSAAAGGGCPLGVVTTHMHWRVVYHAVNVQAAIHVDTLVMLCSQTSNCQMTSASSSLAACTTSRCAPCTRSAAQKASREPVKPWSCSAPPTPAGAMAAAILTWMLWRSSWPPSSPRSAADKKS